MTYEKARNALPDNSEWTCSCGYPGEGGYSEYYRAPDGRRFVVANGNVPTGPFAWTATEVQS